MDFISSWIRSATGSKRTQAYLLVVLPLIWQIIKLLQANQPIPAELIWGVIGATGFWQGADSIRPTDPKPKPDEVAK